MLKQLRRHRNVQILIFAGLTVLFVLWGVGGTLSTRQAAFAGTIFGRKVPFRTFLEQQEALLRTLRWTLGDVPLSPEVLEQQTWMRLILLEEARQQHLHVTDEQVVQAIQQMPFFQRDGGFDQERYAGFLRFQRLEPRRFEEEIRQQLLIEQLRAHITRTAAADEDRLTLWQTYLENAFQRAQVTSNLPQAPTPPAGSESSSPGEPVEPTSEGASGLSD